jgi:putative hydrolase of the HAD superfamily
LYLAALMIPRFIYFDLGKVLLDFSFDRACLQIGAAAGIEPDRVRAALSSGIQVDYETGKLDSRGFHERFCRKTGACPEYDAFFRGYNEIFTPITSMLPVVSQLYQSGYRLGVLSNTCEGHWDYCLRRYVILRELFSVYALSYKIGSMKPSSVIYCRAAALAGCRPEEIFYTDDIASNVAGARSAGLDAIVYTSTAELVKELWSRGVKFNY